MTYFCFNVWKLFICTSHDDGRFLIGSTQLLPNCLSESNFCVIFTDIQGGLFEMNGMWFKMRKQ